MYAASIQVKDTGVIAKTFQPETKRFSDRSSYTLSSSGGTTKFKVKAKDVTAFRATLNSITKILTVIEKMRDLK